MSGARKKGEHTVVTWRWAATALLLAVSLAAAGCQKGEDGKVYGIFIWNSTVSQMTLTGLGVPVTNSTPDPSKIYELKAGRATVLWTAAPNNYALAVSILPDPGKEPHTFSDGEDGVDQTLLFYFSGDTLSMSPLIDKFNGVMP